MKKILKLRNKCKKLFSSPSIFFRDFLLKRYPVILNQSNIPMGNEIFFAKTQETLINFCQPDFPIDVVLTWVDGNDVKWLAKKNNYLLDKEYIRTATDSARFMHNNELYYSVLSIVKNMDWVRNIYVVTDGQCPNLPTAAKDKVIIVDHTDIIPKQYLPTFNSHVIEAYIYNIKGLSEHFIYFNDDFFVAKTLKKQHFFLDNGVSSLFLTEKSLSHMSNIKINTPTQYASLNCNNIFLDFFNKSFDKPLVHTYVPLRKSVYSYAHEMFYKEIEKFSSNRFRGETDLNMATFLVPYLQYLKGLSVPQIDICYYFNIRSENALFAYNQLLNLKKNKSSPHSFCANDFSISLDMTGRPTRELVKFLEKYYQE